MGVALSVWVALAACASEPPALEVAGVAYEPSDVLGLSESRLRTLAALTAFGAAVAEGRLEELGEPVIERRTGLHLARLMDAHRALESGQVDDEQLEARYLVDPEHELTVRHLIVLSPRFETEEVRARARAKARRALERIRAGEPFPDVAAEVSEEPGAEGRQGLLEPGREGAWVDEFWQAASALEVGEVSGVVETQYGFHVLRLEDRDVVPFDEARQRVTLDVFRLMGGEEEDAPPGFRVTADLGSLAALDAAEVVATWDGGTLTAGAFRTWLAALPESELEATLDPARPPDGEREAAQAARAEAARAWARREGVSVGEPVAAGFRRDWLDEVEAWATAFGLAPGMGPDALRDTALSALAATGQTAGLMRAAVEERRPLLARLYPALRGPRADDSE